MELSISFFNQHLTQEQKYNIYKRFLLSPYFINIMTNLFEYGLKNDKIDDLYLLVEFITENNIILANYLGIILIDHLKEKDLTLNFDKLSL